MGSCLIQSHRRWSLRCERHSEHLFLRHWNRRVRNGEGEWSIKTVHYRWRFSHVHLCACLGHYLGKCRTSNALENGALCCVFQSFINCVLQLLVAGMVQLSPLLASTSAIGLYQWLGEPMNPLMSVTPVLVLGVGVDDAFLILHSWLHYKRNGSSCAVLSLKADFSAASASKLGTVLAETGSNMSITSFTNTLAFLIGATTPVPHVRLFSCKIALHSTEIISRKCSANIVGNRAWLHLRIDTLRRLFVTATSWRLLREEERRTKRRYDEWEGAN